jgi:hypothetical protein
MFGWIDSNVGVNFSKICKDFKYEYLLDILNINDNKFHIQILNVADKNHKTNKKDYYSKYQWVVCGCLFITNKIVGAKILNRLNEIFVETTLMGYGHAEEMLFLEVLDEFYDDIEKSYGDYGQIINNFITTTENLHYIFYLIIRKYIQFKYYKECYHCCKKMLYSIENNKIECCEKIHMFVLLAYYISASQGDEFLNLSNSEHKEYIKNIIDKIYKICNEDEKMKNEFYNNRDYYLNTF